jgi:hypothetical protein
VEGNAPNSGLLVCVPACEPNIPPAGAGAVLDPLSTIKVNLSDSKLLPEIKVEKRLRVYRASVKALNRTNRENIFTHNKELAELVLILKPGPLADLAKAIIFLSKKRQSEDYKTFATPRAKLERPCRATSRVSLPWLIPASALLRGLHWPLLGQQQ